MILRMSKKLLLLSCLISGVIVGMHLDRDNCQISLVDIVVEETKTAKASMLLLSLDNNPTDSLFFYSFFSRIKTIAWDEEKSSILHITFEDDNKDEINVNNIRWSGRFENEFLATRS